MAARCNCWNELKEEIKANATIFKPGDFRSVYPVNRTAQIKRQKEHERQDGGQEQSFSQVLDSAREENQKAQKSQRDEKLRLMGGLNQYNRYAVEFVFMLSSDTDFRV